MIVAIVRNAYEGIIRVDWREPQIVLLLFAVASGGLVYSAVHQAPVHDELGHWCAGMSYWQFGDVDSFKVNPPLLRALGALPAYASGYRLRESVESSARELVDRPEFRVGHALFDEDPQRVQFLLTLGRLWVVASTLLAGGLLYSWAKRLAGPTAGLLAAFLWLSQPETLSHGVLLTGDAFCAAAVLGAAWVIDWAFRDWNLRRAALTGAAIGAAVLSKFTALVLVPVYVLCLINCLDRYPLRRLMLGSVFVAVMFLSVLGIPYYPYDPWAMPLADYKFVSDQFSDLQQSVLGWAAYVPIDNGVWLRPPVPRMFLMGLDRQQWDFERGLYSYAAGLRSNHGWWWFYLYAMLVKIPLGSWLLIAAAALTGALLRRQIGSGLMVPIAVLITVLLLTAYKSGFAQQHRYVIPAFPLLFLATAVVLSRALQVCRSEGKRWGWHGLRCALGVGTLATVIATCAWAPHWLGFFNLPAGGMRSGFRCLINDASEWGQDLYVLRDWINRQNPRIPVFVRAWTSQAASHLRAVGARAVDAQNSSFSDLPKPCLFVISKSDYVWDSGFMTYLDRLQPIEHVGSGFLVFYLDEEGAKS